MHVLGRDESVDCFFADPPFNLGKDYGTDVHDEHPEDHAVGDVGLTFTWGSYSHAGVARRGLACTTSSGRCR